MRWLWWRTNSWAEITAILVSLVTAVGIIFFAFPAFPPGPEGDALQLLYMALVSTLAALAAIFIAGPEDNSGLEEFYRRARPPGVWGKIAEAVDGPSESANSEHRLERAIAAMLICAGSVFCLLVAVGSFLMASPPPTWMPNRTIWILLLAGAGLASIPVWWRLGMNESGR